MPAAASLAATPGPLQGADAFAEVTVLGQERVCFVDDEFGGGRCVRIDRRSRRQRRLRREQPDDERDREQDADDPRA